MNFQQLRILQETVKRNFNLTEVANALFTSQSGVSKHIKDLEDELGVEIFVRKGKRLLGLTEPGKELISIAQRILLDTKNMRRLGDQFSQRDQGLFTVATTHTQARYSLPQVVTAFKKEFPKVHLSLHQSSPTEIVELLLSGEADIGIATEALVNQPELVTFPYYSWHHTIIVPLDHPLTKHTKLTLEDIAEYPIVTYHTGMTGRTKIDEAFAQQGVIPDIVLSALDADVIKTYVELGLGVGIIASMAFNPARDKGLQTLNSEHLWSENITRIAIRRGHYLKSFMYRFLNLCSDALNEQFVKEKIRPNQDID